MEKYAVNLPNPRKPGERIIFVLLADTLDDAWDCVYELIEQRGIIITSLKDIILLKDGLNGVTIKEEPMSYDIYFNDKLKMSIHITQAGIEAANTTSKTLKIPTMPKLASPNKNLN